MLGLPQRVTACLFDLDGVLTPTAVIHNTAWTRTFDDFLKGRAGQRPFDPVADYNDYVDGKPREAGVRDFLASRGIALPEGTPGDPPDAQTVHGLGNRKNALLLTLIKEGLEPYPGSVRYLHAAAGAGLRRAVVSSSANTLQVITSTGLAPLLEVRVDGGTIRERGLRGKPAPDTFLEAAKELGVAPEHAAVFEDALAGVAAGRAGGFGCVVGVDRIGGGHADDLRAAGADVVVPDLDVLLEG
ncbi:beta-phosphoglucomutase family hydrolase [Dactylosporangium aurantiacum]|uniref:Beta-phosphoglucomutase n=1 Tax=Dactylosporangium aurantiacum TaxID=35754 RepID=A0A9Q9IGD8_9ACTN|nr:beta-phosphoglucomutase family hydrolase [Dactylosporangium aurantiacum]MDG6108121.1 beta-phosphoglucomutase family hydrolase [Dactylosporangium aurantiacum]UWZ53750.1 beta-phosphoglucomutase family hydrolase [Dactylosporangium aurantiacum]